MDSDSLAELAGKLRRTDQALFDALARLEQRFDAREPELHAFLPEDGRFERLRDEAAALVDRYPNADHRPALFGVPIGVKDIFHVDGHLTRAGAPVPPDVLQGEEASSVTALREAGALILGKTVTTEFAYFGPGPTRHPLSEALGETRTPGGSSSGSAAAVAAGLAPLALGTQTIGSICRPAAFCGVLGYKPTFGRVPADGIIPLAPSADTVGFFVSDAASAAMVAAVWMPDWQPAALEAPPVLGVPEGSYLERATREGLAHFRATCERLAAAGFIVCPVPALEDFDTIYRKHNQLVAYEAARTHAAWYSVYGDRYHPKTTDLIVSGQAVSDRDYERALESRVSLRDELAELMLRNHIDAWISPPAPGPALAGLESTGNPVMNLPWTHAGVPAVSLPAGANAAGWPMGLQVTGGFGDDEALLATAAQVEQVLRSQ